MSERHRRDYYFIAGAREMRGSVTRAATPSERQTAFRFSEIVRRGTPPTSDALIAALSERMPLASNERAQAGHIPAGFTYLGQFVDHDLTRDVTRNLPFGTPASAAVLAQGRSPALDLDSLYGGGPGSADAGAFYAADGASFVLGTTIAVPAIAIPNGPSFPAFPARDGFDLPRRGQAATVETERRMAAIPEPRNDENLAIAQTHLAFMRFHNSVVRDLAGAGTPSARLFAAAQAQVVRCYQWMLVHDYLPRIVDPAIVDSVFTEGRRVFEVDATDFPTMPIEFSVAAFRLGHSMIRAQYDWNEVFHPRPGALDQGSLVNLFRFSGTSGNLSPGSNVDEPLDGTLERLPTNWIADWTRLYDFAADAGIAELAPPAGAFLNPALRLDTRLTDPLANLPLGSFGARGTAGVPAIERNLAHRNLVRGRMVALATAQEVAVHFRDVAGVQPILQEADLLVGDGIDLSDLPAAVRHEAVTATPLWFYILREAEKNSGRLGPIGGRIVAETFHRAIEGSRISILRDPTWRPPAGLHAGGFGMVDILLAAYDRAQGELRPLSPNAPR
jgi:hypothetical protein